MEGNINARTPEEFRVDLGKVTVGKSCIRFKKVEDLNMGVLKKVLKEAQRAGGAGSESQIAIP